MYYAIKEQLVAIGNMIHQIEYPLIRMVLQIALIVAAAWATYWLICFAYKCVKAAVLKRGEDGVRKILMDSPVIPRALQVFPLIVGGVLIRAVLHEGTPVQKILLVVEHGYFIFICSNVFSALMTLVYNLNNYRRGVTASPQKGLFQVLSLLGYAFGGIAIVATLSGRDPTYILSGLTALSAVFMLVFKDSILGLTAGITLASNKMVQIGDWIEVPGTDADGNVVDIALTTVSVQNWDNTITTLPAYNLVANPFKNWRGMSDSGGRRIKRAIHIDLDSVKFANEKMLKQWENIDLIRDYISGKLKEIETYNASHPTSKECIANARNLTNIGTFRAYCYAYLRNHPKIHKGMTILVRQLQPNDRGIPLEIYCFTNTTAWVDYEDIQSDIFDHLLALMEQFELSSFQVSSATSMRGISSKILS